ncbi:unnamed protein product [Owenia fusiformis]|uniref:Uncharacterized protein n=1 Tax=Owenia fusiformis TaxID=6347 RepID=A0A8S4N208_OWEFU|nr:unnamed protein product [Owenia fusiformis]
MHKMGSISIGSSFWSSHDRHRWDIAPGRDCCSQRPRDDCCSPRPRDDCCSPRPRDDCCSPRPHHRPGEDCCKCMCKLCVLFFLKNRMSTKRKIFLLWTGIGILTLLIGLTVRFGIYGQKSISAAPGDSLLLPNYQSAFMCTGIDIKLSQINTAVDVLQFSKTPPLSETKLSQKLQKGTTVLPFKYEFWGFHLLPGSNVQVDTTIVNDIDLYVIKGKMNLERWKNDAECWGCKLASYTYRYIPGRSSTKFTANIPINKEDDYFFIYASLKYTHSNLPYTAITAGFLINRAQYDTTNPINKCSLGGNNQQCSLDMNYLSPKKILINFKPDSELDNIDVVTYCYPRYTIYFILFLIIPGLIGSAITFVLFIKDYCRKRNGQYSLFTNVTSSLYPRQQSNPNPRYSLIEDSAENDDSYPSTVRTDPYSQPTHGKFQAYTWPTKQGMGPSSPQPQQPSAPVITEPSAPIETQLEDLPPSYDSLFQK